MLSTDGYFSLTVYGARGSIPVSAKDRLNYGGNTSCYCVRIGERMLLLDCGSGAYALCQNAALPPRIDIFLSHMHLDHILGVPFFSPLFDPAFKITVFGEPRGQAGISQQLTRVLSAPQWPVGTRDFCAQVSWKNISAGDTLDLGDGIRVKTLRSNHPNLCTLFRIEAAGKSLVYALDFEHEPQACRRLAGFANECDLLIYDAHYTDEEYSDGKAGWGHSTWQEGIRLARDCGAHRLLLSHHSPERTDEQLDALTNIIHTLPDVRGDFRPISFARDGEVITL